MNRQRPIPPGGGRESRPAAVPEPSAGARVPPRVLSLSSILLVLLGIALSAAAPEARAAEDPASRDDEGAAARPTLSVTADAEVEAPPDTATVTVGATAQAREAAAAQEQVNRIVRDALDAIVELGVPREQVQTAALSVHPVYSDPQPPRPADRSDGEPSEPTIVAYRASNTIEVRVRELDQVGDVIDAAIKAGANELRGVSFTLADDTEPRRRALREAARRARAEAEALADAMGLRLGQVLEVTTGGADVSPPTPRYFAAEAIASRAAATPVQPGQVRVRATLRVRYLIDAQDERPSPAPADDSDRDDRGPSNRISREPQG